MVSAGAADLANQVAVAMEAGAGLSRLSRTIHVYPTRCYGLLQVASLVRMEHAASSRRVRVLRRLAWRR